MSANNPFPGMNPYMEQTWPDVHLSLIGYVREALGAELPDDLVAKAEQNVDVLQMPGGERRGVRPDVAIIAENWERGLPPVWVPENSGGAVAVSEPELLTIEEPPHRWIEIRTDLGELVTAIEVLSPTNKTARREVYRQKREELVAAGVNVVEIDLLRAGPRTIDLPDSYQVSPQRGEHYLICASRGVVPGRREVYRCLLRERLPAIRIPLRVTDPDVPLDLQALIDRCYASGRYWKLDYTQTLTPPLAESDAAWAEERLAGAGLRIGA